MSTSAKLLPSLSWPLTITCHLIQQQELLYTKAVQKCSISDRIHEHDIASANFKVKKKITWIHLINTISKLIHQLNISKINPGLYMKLLALISRYLSRLYIAYLAKNSKNSHAQGTAIIIRTSSTCFISRNRNGTQARNRVHDIMNSVCAGAFFWKRESHPKLIICIYLQTN